MLDYFFEIVEVSSLSEEDREVLDFPIQEYEVIQAIDKLKLNKSTGMDGLAAEFYKKCEQVLATQLTDTIVVCLWEGSLSFHLLGQNETTLIYKADKNPTLPQSHFKTNDKILTLILAARLSTALSKYIHPDQSGFLPDRYLGSNIRRVMNAREPAKIQQQTTSGYIVSPSINGSLIANRRKIEFFKSSLHSGMEM